MKNSLYDKTILVFLTLVLFSHTGFTQKNLDSNPVFSNFASKNIYYPKGAVNYSLYGRIFTKFEVDNKGRINNVRIIYPIMNKYFEKKSGFENMIHKGLAKVPNLGLGYQGKYLLPLAFIYTNYGKTPTVSRPNNLLPSYINVEDLTILREIEVKGFSSSNSEYALMPEKAPPSKQIID